MFVRRREMKPGDFEYESFKILQQRGHKVERMNSAQLWRRFPAWNPEFFEMVFLSSKRVMRKAVALLRC